MILAPEADIETAAVERTLQDENFRTIVSLYSMELSASTNLRRAYEHQRKEARAWEDIADLRGVALDGCEGRMKALRVWAGIGKGVAVTVGVAILSVAVDQYMEGR